MGEIRADTHAIWQERHDLLEEIRRMSSGLAEVAKAAAARVSLGEHELDTEARGEDATDQVTAPIAAVGADDKSSEAG